MKIRFLPFARSRRRASPRPTNPAIDRRRRAALAAHNLQGSSHAPRALDARRAFRRDRGEGIERRRLRSHRESRQVRQTGRAPATASSAS